MAATSEPTQKELVIELRGEMREGFAEIKGEIKALAQVVVSGNDARAAETSELRKDVDDHEDRIRALEAKPTVTPKGLWAVVVSVVTVAGTVIGIIYAVIGK